MAVIRLSIVLLVSCISLVLSAPSPGFFGPKHEHVIIHVPYNIHTIHHHHIQKVPIIKHVPYIKHVPIYKEVPIVKEVPIHLHEYKGWSNSGWW